MQYYTTTKIGDSGVFFLGYWITNHFGWPFRILSSDIGIDAEFELTGHNNHSLGLIVKGQVKTTKTGISKDFTVPIEHKHIEYWTSLTVPVILFKVDLANKKIFFKVISSLDDMQKDENGWQVKFYYNEDELTPLKQKEIIERFASIEVQGLYAYINQVESLVSDINPNVTDVESYGRQKEKINSAEIILRKLEGIKALYPWKFGKRLDAMINKIERSLNSLNNDLERIMTENSHY